MASMKKPILFMNFVAVTGMGIRDYSTMMSRQGLVIRREWPDWNRSHKQGTKSKFNGSVILTKGS